MDHDSIIFTACDSGPYRFVRELVKSEGVSWFPWGYRARQVAPSAGEVVASGIVVELWAVDDVRSPTSAEPLALAEIDYVGRTGEYVAMTLRIVSGTPKALEPTVLDGISRGFLAFGAADVRAGASAGARAN